MRKTRKSKRNLPVYSSSDEEPLKKKQDRTPPEKKKQDSIPPEKIKTAEDSSSESDIETYLKPINEIDLNSTFFTANNGSVPSFEAIEKDIFSGINRLSDLDSDMEEVETNITQGPAKHEIQEVKVNFQQFFEYTKKIEEAKKFVEETKSDKIQEKKINIDNLLALGEARQSTNNVVNLSNSVHSSEYETFSESEEGYWEEVLDGKIEKKETPRRDIEITVALPNQMRKKKGVDLLMAMKRRLNRMKKENQVLIHKVHLLCWIAHGNYVNNVLNGENLLGLSLSLLPSEQCYPSGRTDLKYLEGIVAWYKKTMKLVESVEQDNLTLEQLLLLEISKKEASNYKNLVYVFICVLRSLGIHCRLILSLQAEPLHPPNTELCSLSTKTNDDEKSKNDSKTPENVSVKKETPSSSKTIEKQLTVKSNKRKTDDGDNKQKTGKQMKEIKNERSSNKELVVAEGVESNYELKKRRNSKKCSNNYDETSQSEITIVVKNNRNSNKTSGNLQEAKANEIKNKRNTVMKSSDPDETDENKKTKPKTRFKNTMDQNKNEAKKIVNKEETKPTKSRSRIKSFNEIEPTRKSINLKKTDGNEKTRSKSTTALVNQGKNKNEAKKNANKVETKPTPSGSRVKRLNELRALEKSIDLKKIDVNLKGKSERRSKSTSALLDQDINVKKRASNEDETKPTKSGSGVKNSNEIATKNTKSQAKTKPNLFKIKIPLKSSKEKQKIVKETAPQLDGMFDSDFDSEDSDVFLSAIKSAAQLTHPVAQNYSNIVRFPEIDGSDDATGTKTSKKAKPNLGKLKLTETNKPKKSGADSEEDFKPRTPFRKKNVTFNSPTVQHSSKKSTINFRKLNEISSEKKAVDVRNDIMEIMKKSLREQKQTAQNKLVKRNRFKTVESDSDYMPEKLHRKSKDSDEEFRAKPKVKKRVLPKSELAKTENVEKQKKKTGIDVWVEVFLESEEKWISLDVVRGQVHCVSEIYSRASHPVSYILSWDNSNRIKDITKRYCQQWNTVTRKLRIDAVWWEKTLKSYKGPKTSRDKEEDEDLARQQLEQPLPKTIGEYKNHPLYALKRHLLKFEAIYPPDAITLGFVRNEAVYSRDCIHTLHSREIWVKHAKVVRPGEQPYKIVKARPKYDRLSNTVITDQPLEIFGSWQIEDYVPPTAENGVVPRNAYGNVELFKACMLPKGTVHLQLPGLNKVTRKMNIDCAPAVVGFDFHSGGSHPTFDGFVVCKEYEDSVIAAWYLEQEEAEKRAQERIEKRVYGNWRRLIRGLLIRERLQARYDFGGPSTSQTGGVSKNKSKGPRFVTKKRRICSDDSDSDR